MSDSTDLESASRSPRSELSDDLPPVQPPSAGFIVQLFVVPGLIVLAVVAVWALFGRIAAGEQDWRKLTLELQSPNDHIRKRAMYGLSQVLDQDRRQGQQGKHLSANPEISLGLAGQLIKELKSGSNSEETVSMQQYLTRALGLLDPPATASGVPQPQHTSGDTSPGNPASVVATALKLALESNRDIEIRKSAVASIAFMAGRAMERGQPLDAPDLTQALVETSTDSQAVLRHAAAFALGLFRSPDADQQLHVLLGNEDVMTRINAAIALSRSGSTDGLAVFKQALLAKAPDTVEGGAENVLILKNTLKAIADISAKMGVEDKTEFRELVQALIQSHPESRVRIDAQNALNSLK